MMKVAMALSGGLDSAVLLSDILGAGNEAHCLTFKYGSKHGHHEQQAALKIVQFFAERFPGKVHHRFVNVFGAISKGNSALGENGPQIPEGHYNEESMRQTVVPGRNTVFAASLLSYAEANQCNIIALGVHKGDHYIYPDCRPKWVDAMQAVVRESSEGRVRLAAPYESHDKAEIVRLGAHLKTPFHLTRTCYKDQEVACGKCGSCTERLEAFRLNMMKDSIPYSDEQECKKIPVMEDYLTRFATLMKNARSNDRVLSGYGISQYMRVVRLLNEVAKANFQYDILKDQPFQPEN